MMVLKHEIVDGLHLFYCNDTNMFVGQGVDLADAAGNFKKSHGSKLGVFYHKAEDKPYCFDNGKCITVNENNP
jgi:hypothetical protein